MNIPSNKTDEERYKNCKFVCECGNEDCDKVFQNPMLWIVARYDNEKRMIMLHPDCNHVSEFELVKVINGVYVMKDRS